MIKEMLGYYVFLITILCMVCVCIALKCHYIIKNVNRYCKECEEKHLEKIKETEEKYIDGYWHTSWLKEAVENYDKEHSTIQGNMSISEFINNNCRDILNRMNKD